MAAVGRAPSMDVEDGAPAREVQLLASQKTESAQESNLLFMLCVGLLALVVQALVSGYTAMNANRILGYWAPGESSGTEQCDGLKMTGMGSFEKDTVKFATTNFLNLYLDKTKDSAAYIEFNISDIDEAPLELAVTALNWHGEDAFYQDGPGWGDYRRYFMFQLSADKTSVEYHRVDVVQRNGDPNYDALYEASKLPNLRLKLAQVGKRVGADCKDTTVIVDASELVKRGFFTVSPAISSMTTPQIDLSTTKAFTSNIDVTVSYSDLTAYGTPVEEKVYRFCVYSLPKDKMKGRPADDRAGYYTVDFKQLGEYYNAEAGWPDHREDLLINPTVRLINKMRFPNRMDGTNVLRYYIDRSVPQPFWEATKLGVNRWQPAFDGIASSFPADDPPRIVAYHPDDPEFPKDFDASDIRFNSISWGTGDFKSIFAIGFWVNDPRTAEALKANIMFTLGRLEGILGRHVVYGGFAHSPALRQFYPQRESGMTAKLDGEEGSWHLAANPSSEQSYNFVNEGILAVTLHEVGHTLGLRHNFRGSISVSFEQTQNKTYVMENGLTSTVMDYLAANYISDETKAALKVAWGGKEDPYQAPIYNPVIGSYDKWVIKYGYYNLPEEASCKEEWCLMGPTLKAIAQEYDTSKFSYATDETRDYSDPYNLLRDLTSDPIRWFLEQAKVVAEGYDNLFVRVQREDRPWMELYGPLTTLMSTSRLAAYRLCYYVGGIVTMRKHGTDCVVDGRPTNCAKQGNTPLGVDDQDRALNGILAALQTQPPAWLQKDAVEPIDLYGISPVDMTTKFYEWKARVLTFLLDAERLRRVHLNGALLGLTNRVQGWLLAACSKSLLGLDMSAADPVMAVRTALQDQAQSDLQVKYLQMLKSLKGSVEDAVVRTAVAAEMERISTTFSSLSAVLTAEGSPMVDVALLADATTALR